MRVLADIDLSNADLEVFEAYEAAVLPRLEVYGGRLDLRIRSSDQQRELHLLYFPNADSLSRFRDDPIREGVMDQWKACGATSTTIEVETL